MNNVINFLVMLLYLTYVCINIKRDQSHPPSKMKVFLNWLSDY